MSLNVIAMLQLYVIRDSTVLLLMSMGMISTVKAALQRTLLLRDSAMELLACMLLGLMLREYNNISHTVFIYLRLDLWPGCYSS